MSTLTRTMLVDSLNATAQDAAATVPAAIGALVVAIVAILIGGN